MASGMFGPSYRKLTGYNAKATQGQDFTAPFPFLTFTSLTDSRSGSHLMEGTARGCTLGKQIWGKLSSVSTKRLFVKPFLCRHYINPVKDL